VISVERIYQRVVKDIARKGQTGYSSSDEFNRDLRDSENILYEFYYKNFQETQKVSDALEPFVKEKPIVISSGKVAYPSDHRHPLEMSYLKAVNSEECAEPTYTEVAMDYLNANEERDTMNSAIRRPSIAKDLLYYTQVNKAMKVLPKELQGKVAYKYLKRPVYGFYAVILDTVRGIEVYDPSQSTDLEWNDQEETNIISLMLLHKGISVRDNDLIQFAITKLGIEQGGGV
jgi:hypothetical protein